MIRKVGKVIVITVYVTHIIFICMLLLAAYSTYISPVNHPVLSCMGLTFPIFLLANVVFLAFWLIVKHYRMAILTFIALLACYPQTSVYLSFNFWCDQPSPNAIRFLSYNVMGFDGCEKNELGENSILNYLKDSEAGIICLQEYATGWDKHQHIMQQDIDEALKDYPYHHIDRLGSGPNKHNRMAIYSKYPILKACPIAYESAYNGSVRYDLLIGEDTVAVINNHLESNKLTKEDKVVYNEMLKNPEKNTVKRGLRQLIGKLAEASAIRAVQADTIARLIAGLQAGKIPVIVCGDFNDTPVSYTRRVIGKGLEDAFEESGQGLGISYNQNHFYFRIDHILVSPQMKATQCVVDRQIRQSDHYPISCYIDFKGDSPSLP